MNDLSCNSICQLLCCPPLPSKIAAKLAFMPPPPSYKLTEEVEGGKVSYRFTLASYLKDSFIHFIPENMESLRATTKRGNDIAILYMPINSSSKLTFLLSHGNAVDLGLMLHFIYELGSKLNVNIMCYDYSGYGASSGKPLEKNLYADAECALNVLKSKYSVPLNQIVLYGQSIGTVPTIHLATLHRVAAVVLHSPLMSGLRVAFPKLKRNYCCDVFSNYVRAPRIISPTLIIHGTEDEIIDRMHAQRLYERIPNTLEPLFIRGAGHNDCELYEEYLIRLEYLVHVEVDGSGMPLFSHESNSPSGSIRFSNGLLKFFRWHRKSSETNTNQISSIRIPKKFKSLKGTQSHKQSTVEINEAPIHCNDRTLTSVTPMWMRKRGLHGSYRYVNNSRTGDKRKCKRIHSVSLISLNKPCNHFKTSEVPEKAEIKLECIHNSSLLSEPVNKPSKIIISLEDNSC
ncbi:hypothetical protein MN116_004643 [Schistosoma mekongi]|uniref:Serine aminopeptidase S33 domain-containing protein n=1 Tax=Schistosoma mekongi TaxID=38744 RepID=A0AAE2D4T1_SCHME|nr:hypothetical protein MN116_004643 [Schistosoma mekongi]